MSIGDAAWFYSTLAQVSAAIVGLMAAFLGARLVSHIADMQALRHEVEGRTSNAQEMLVDRFRRPKEYEARSGKSVAQPLSTLYSPASGELREQEIRERVIQLRRVIPNFLSGGSREENEVKAQILHDAETLEALADGLNALQRQVVPRPFIAIVRLLGFLSLVGIVWPLSALPGLSVPLFFPKWIMLVLFTLAMAVLIFYFELELRALQRSGHLNWPEPRG